MLKIKIKASDITSLTDARYFAAKEVEWLCFNFTEGSATYIEPMKARAMIEWVEGVKIVGEFERATADEINFYTDGWGLELVQLDFLTPIETVQNVKNVAIIKEFIIDEFTKPDFLKQQLALFAPYVAAFQLSFDTIGVSWEALKSLSTAITLEDLKEVTDEFNIILSINLELDKLDEVLKMNFYGLDIKGGEEERVGVKSFDELDEILEALEVLD